MAGSMTCVLLLASGASWEAAALNVLDSASGVVVLKRCVDVDDLLASVGNGQAQVAVVSLDAPGLDRNVIVHLRRHSVAPIAVVGESLSPEALARADRLDVGSVIEGASIAELPRVVAEAATASGSTSPGGSAPSRPALRADRNGRDLGQFNEAGAPGEGSAPGEPGAHRTIAVWGPAGAPGRTTIATCLAGELAKREAVTLLVDADPVAPSVAQHLGILDEVSGVLSAARLAGTGQLRARFPQVVRGLDATLGVLTGLPRADRWIEVRTDAIADIVALAAEAAHVVLDTGPSLEAEQVSDFGSTPSRHTMTLEALAAADEIVVVGAADPVGLARLSRGLVELREVTGGAAVRVVVNRMRPSLGWSEPELAAMISGFSRISGLHVVPEDRAAADRALTSGRGLFECSDNAITDAISELADAVLPASLDRAAPRRRRRSSRPRRRTTVGA